MDSLINQIDVFSDNEYVLFPFYKDGKPLGALSPKWGMTLKKAGSMRFRWNEKNPVRKNMFSSILSDYSLQSEFVPVELIHSKIVYDVSSVEDTKVFPSMLSEMIKVGENTGNLEEVLKSTGSYFDTQVESSIAKAVAIIEPIAIIILGLVVAFVVLSVIIPIMSMMNAV